MITGTVTINEGFYEAHFPRKIGSLKQAIAGMIVRIGNKRHPLMVNVVHI